MKRKLFVFFMLTLLLGCSSTKTNVDSQNSYLNSDVVSTINESVFEVVIKKPKDENVKYEKAIPYDLIPFKVRNDEYIPIGTAFAINESEFITAAHVLSLESKTFVDQFFLRDKNENIFEIDTVVKYYDKMDFLVFNLKNKKVKKYLKINKEYQLNNAVYAVGNALGEGIIIRNGLLNNETPEEISGQFKWLRFSAPASPGNSGGPLINANGEVIGIVIGKTENENLNFALPIKEIFSIANGKGKVEKKYYFGLSNFNDNTVGEYNYDFDLPLDYKVLRENLIGEFKKYYTKQMDRLMTEKKDKFFPYEKSSNEVIYQNYWNKFPYLLSNKENEKWTAYEPQKIESGDYGKDGYVEYGTIYDLGLSFLKKDENEKISKLMNDDLYFMDTFLKGYIIYRNIGQKQIRMNSLGKAIFVEDVEDSYKRKWRFRTYDFEYVDYKILVASSPTPNGIVSIIKIATTNQVYDYNLDMKKIINFVTFSYMGEISEWDEFIAMEKYLPKHLESVNYSLKDESLDIELEKNKISFKQDIIKTDKESFLVFNNGFEKEGDQLLYKVNGMEILENLNTSNYIFLEKQTKPVESLTKNYHDNWKIYKEKKFPYNNESYSEDGSSNIQKIIQKNEDELYILSISNEGDKESSFMSEKMEKLSENIEIK